MINYDRTTRILTIKDKEIKIPNSIAIGITGNKKEAIIYMSNLYDYKGQRVQFPINEETDIESTTKQIRLWVKNENSKNENNPE